MTIADRDVREAADRAAGALTRLGWPRLAAAVGGRAAQFDCNFETYTKLRQVIFRPDGKPYHRESIGRAVRQLRDAGMLKVERVFMGAKMPGAKYASARGTTLKTFNWRAITEKNPLSRRQRRLARQQQAAVLRASGELVKPLPACAATRDPSRPRFSVPATAAPPPLDAATAAVIEQARSAWERREAAAGGRNGPVPSRSSAAEKPPPD